MTYDVAVVGAGLAGCSAAITLAQQGKSVLLLEAKAFPHHKVCGEFLSPVSIEYLDRLGVLPQVLDARPAHIHHVSVNASDRVCWERTLPGTGYGISRWTLDQILVEQARTCGVQLLEKTQVLEVQGNLDVGFVLRGRFGGYSQLFEARTVIGAYGKTSNLDRTFARSHSQNEFIALKNHFHGPPLHHQINLYTFPGGYCGMSEIESGRTNVCLLVRQEVFRAVSDGDIPTFIAWMRSQNRGLDAWMSSAAPILPAWQSISRISFASKSLLERDVLMTGDAAGLIAPLAGDGMEMALRGGQMAAAALYPFLTEQCSSNDLRRRYQQNWRNAYKTRLGLARLLQSVMLNPPMLSTGLQVLNRIPSLGDFIISQTRDMEPAVL